MNKKEEMIEKFYNSLKNLGVTYNEDTGWLSEMINFVIYKNRTFLPAKRVFIVGEQFVIFEEDSVRKIKFDNVVGFNLIKNG